MSTILTPNHQFRFLTLPTSQDISKPTKSLSIPDTTNFPFPFTSTTSLTSLAMSTLTKFLNRYHSTSTNTQNTTTPTLFTSYTTIIHHCQDALHAKLSNTYFQAINTTTYTYLLALTSTPTHRGFPDYLLNGLTDCTVALVFFPITSSTHINAPNATLITPSTP